MYQIPSMLFSASKKNKKIAIIGSGLVGTLLAILLAKEGFEVHVYEKRKDPRRDLRARGRTIALSLSDRGWKALRQIGLEDTIRDHANPSYGRIVHHGDGTTQSQDYGDGSQAIYTVNRHFLNVSLLNKAMETGGVRLFFQHESEGLDKETGEITFIDCKTKEKTRKRYDHIIGADGMSSAIRNSLAEQGVWNFESAPINYGYKELRIPPNAQGEHAVVDHRTHVWPRKNALLIAFPTRGGHFVSTIFLPLTGPNSLESLNTKEALMAFFEKEFKDAIPLMPTLEEDFFLNPPSTITQVKGSPWHYKDKVVLIGDACHAITPFYGMGMNTGFEDCTVFMQLLQENSYNFAKTFEIFERVRKPDADAITDLSYKNFQSINESPDPSYHNMWLLERRIWKLIPDRWVPGYVLIAFSDVHLSQVAVIKANQDRILHKIIDENPNVQSLLDEELKTMVEEELALT